MYVKQTSKRLRKTIYAVEKQQVKYILSVHTCVIVCVHVCV
jgi:preprotein translocase subunit SecE